MKQSNDPYGLDAIDEALDRGIRSAMRESPDVPTQARIRRWHTFGFGMLILSVFCVALIAVPWPNKSMLDILMWTSFAVVLLLLGAWQVDKANKEEVRSMQLLDQLTETGESAQVVGGLRRVK